MTNTLPSAFEDANDVINPSVKSEFIKPHKKKKNGKSNGKTKQRNNLTEKKHKGFKRKSHSLRKSNKEGKGYPISYLDDSNLQLEYPPQTNELHMTWGSKLMNTIPTLFGNMRRMTPRNTNPFARSSKTTHKYEVFRRNVESIN